MLTLLSLCQRVVEKISASTGQKLLADQELGLIICVFIPIVFLKGSRALTAVLTNRENGRCVHQVSLILSKCTAQSFIE